WVERKRNPSLAARRKMMGFASLYPSYDSCGGLGSLEQRCTRHEGVERRPELRPVAVLLLQDLVLGAGDDEVRAGAQVIGEFLDRRGRDDGIVARCQHQD